MRFLRRAGHEPLGPAGEELEPVELDRAPHCDATILHAPGECEFCDKHPGWQALRGMWGINFTGHSDPAKSPCPSTLSRSESIRDAWPRNRPFLPS